MMRIPLLTAAATIVSASLLLSACGDDRGGNDTTPSPQPTTGRTVVTTPAPQLTPTVDIRDVDIASLEDVVAALEESGGAISQPDVIYADLTNDGYDDAIAPVSIDGTLGMIGFFVLAPDGDSARVVLEEFPADSGGLILSVEGDKLVMIQPAPGPDDPECCPSFLRRTVYAWNGAALAVESVTTEPNPGLGPTPVGGAGQ
jgi:hypothetical protein